MMWITPAHFCECSRDQRQSRRKRLHLIVRIYSRCQTAPWKGGALELERNKHASFTTRFSTQSEYESKPLETLPSRSDRSRDQLSFGMINMPPAQFP
jgi:hypothetical protein